MTQIILRSNTAGCIREIKTDASVVRLNPSLKGNSHPSGVKRADSQCLL